MSRELAKSDEARRAELTPLEYDVMWCSATEAPFTGEYWNHHEPGTYRCKGCGTDLFSSADKFDSGTGWPSFTEPAAAENVETQADLSHSMVRTEVLCHKCGAHLGHVFTDGPGQTGLRYCINSASLHFAPDTSR